MGISIVRKADPVEKDHQTFYFYGVNID